MLFESDQTILFTQWVVRPSQKTFLSSFTESMSSSCFYYEMILKSFIYLTVVFVSNLKTPGSTTISGKYLSISPHGLGAQAAIHQTSFDLFQLFGKITLKTWLNQRVLMLLTLKENYTGVSLSFCISTTELWLIEV